MGEAVSQSASPPLDHTVVDYSPPLGTNFRSIGDGTRVGDGELGGNRPTVTCLPLHYDGITSTSRTGAGHCVVPVHIYVVPILHQAPKGGQIFARWCVCAAPSHNDGVPDLPLVTITNSRGFFQLAVPRWVVLVWSMVVLKAACKGESGGKHEGGLRRREREGEVFWKERNGGRDGKGSVTVILPPE